MTIHSGSTTVQRRIRRSGNVQPRAAAVSGRHPGSAPQPPRASAYEPLYADKKSYVYSQSWTKSSSHSSVVWSGMLILCSPDATANCL